MRPPTDFSDLWEMVLRRRWWILVPTLLIGASTVALVSKLPKTYRSETLILVDPQKVPPDFVKATVTTDVNSRLQIISQEILSRTHLQRIIDEFGLYRDESKTDKAMRWLLNQGSRTQEEIINEMRKDIAVEIVADDQAQHDTHRALGAFRISYEGENPALVQQVTREIASLFIDENEKVREQQAEGTTHFIDDELEAARKDLDDQQRRVRDFKASHMGSLPEQSTANLQYLSQLQTSLQVNSEALARAEEEGTYQKSLLAVVERQISDNKTGGIAAPQIESQVQTQLELKREELRIAQQKYRPQHPDVIQLKEEVSALEKLAAEPIKNSSSTRVASGATAVATTDQLVPAQIRGQIAELSDEVKRRSAQQAAIEGEIKQLQSREQSMPTVEEQMSELDRDYQTSKLNYDSLLEKKNASAMAAEMERRAEGEQFRVLDPASFPEKPFKPNVEQLALVGVFGGVFVGCGLAMFMELKDKSINSAKDASFYLTQPVLASLPLLGDSVSPKNGRANGKGEVSRLRTFDLQPKDEVVIPEVLELTPGPASEETGSAPSQPWQALPRQLVVAHSQQGGEQDAYAKEQFRMIRTRLVELRRVRPIRTVMVTSALQGEGKTWVAANLAYSMSRLPGLRVLLVDADLKGAGVGRLLKIEPQVGLSTYLANGKNLGGVRLQLRPNLDLVPTLRLDEDSAEMLSTKRMHDFLDEASRDHDLVILDTPPLLTLSDAQVLTSLVDAAVLVVRAGSSPHDLAKSAIELLEPKIVGVIVNGVKQLSLKGYRYDYYYPNAGNPERLRS